MTSQSNSVGDRLVAPVILAGGTGSRLWPLSRTGRPKQFLSFDGDETLMQQTVRRFSGAQDDVAFAAPIISTSGAYLEDTRRQLNEIGAQASAIILEPCVRNTAPAAIVAAAVIAEQDPDRLMLISPADHHVADAAGMRAAVSRGAAAAEAGKIVTFGIRPTGPETAYGYICAGEAGFGAHAVERFHEKPTLDRATELISDPRWLWNAGVFLSRARVLLDEAKAHCPDIYEMSLRALEHARREADGAVALDPQLFGEVTSESLDYAVMEKTPLCAVVEVDVGWSDVGSWSAVFDAFVDQSSGNAEIGDAIVEDCSGTLILASDIPVAAVGVSDLVIVSTAHGVLVAPRSQAQRVKVLVEEMKLRGREDLL